jgi:hypothetical protein
MLGKSKSLTSNITRRKHMALKSLKDGKEIIVQAERGSCTGVLNESSCREKISGLIDSAVYEILHKDPTSYVETKIRSKNLPSPLP